MMLYRNPFMSGRLGRSGGRSLRWLALIMAVVVIGVNTLVVNAQSTPGITLTINGLASTTIKEHQAITFQVNVVVMTPFTPDLQLLSPLPAGANFTVTTNPQNQRHKIGVFSWTPTENQGGQNFRLQFRGAGLHRHDSVVTTKEVTLSVVETNTAPQFQYIPSQVVDEQRLMEFVVVAVDPDIPAQDKTYRIEQLPSPEAYFDTWTGEFTWPTTEADGGTTGYLLFVVSDSEGAWAFQYVEYTVNEVNNAPVITPIDDLIVTAGDLMTYVLHAVDYEVPAQTLTYSAENLPAGASFNTLTGEFIWQTTWQDAGKVEFVRFTVTDNGEPPQAATYTTMIWVYTRGGSGGENLLKNPGFQVEAKNVKQAKGWKGVDLLENDKRVCKPASDTAAEICEFRFLTKATEVTDRALSQKVNVETLKHGDTVKVAGKFRAEDLTDGAQVTLVATLATGETTVTTIDLTAGGMTDPAVVHSFEQNLALTAAPVEMWLEISTGHSSGKLFLDDLSVMSAPAVSAPVSGAAIEPPSAPMLIPVPAAPDLRGGAAIGMGQ